ncbi:MAG: hypothetical protein C5B50_04405 [Verrucomicrobia bacterium]|nr:MAG: hypothetical protein C5B50_04405 [Verrucomicrobiota bacterium]
MKTIAKLAIIGACVALGVARTSAQTTNSGTIVTTLNFQLQADVQTSDTVMGKATAGNKQIINALLGSNAPNATIVVKDDQSGSGPAFFVRQTTGKGHNAVVTDTDVSGLMTVGQLDISVQVNSTGGQVKESDIVTLTLGSNDSGLDFVLQGYLTRGAHQDGTKQKISVKCLTGTGHVNGNPAVFHDGGATSTSSKVESD